MARANPGGHNAATDELDPPRSQIVEMVEFCAMRDERHPHTKIDESLLIERASRQSSCCHLHSITNAFVGVIVTSRLVGGSMRMMTTFLT
jgi:hypothetical protein